MKTSSSPPIERRSSCLNCILVLVLSSTATLCFLLTCAHTSFLLTTSSTLGLVSASDSLNQHSHHTSGLAAQFASGIEAHAYSNNAASSSGIGCVNALKSTPAVVGDATNGGVTLAVNSPTNSATCEELDSCTDKPGFEAIRWLHRQLDDDANGNVDISESDEFLRDELQYENGYDRHKNFHGNDKHISVDDLWKYWKVSEVHNWTTAETVEWLVASVELPQYSDVFIKHSVNGASLPRLAQSTEFMTRSLGIKDPIHRQKISLKAMDVVLFGPQRRHNYVKDVVLVLSLVLAIGGCWFAVVQHKSSQTHLKKMLKDMNNLQKAEEQLMDLQTQLDKARHEQEAVISEKQSLEEKLKSELAAFEVKESSYRDSPVSGDESCKVFELEEELREAREKLSRAEAALSKMSWSPPLELQQWLQLTHELEIKNYNMKRQAAEMQLGSAKEGCEKLRKKRSTFMGSFRVAHGTSIDDVDNRIIQAKTALKEVTNDLQERLNRWRNIEQLCGFSIVHNQGLSTLQNVLTGAGSVTSLMSSRTSQPSLTRTNSEGTLHESEDSYNANF